MLEGALFLCAAGVCEPISPPEALGITRTTCTAAGVASSGGRGRASSAAACPSLGSRTLTSFTTGRHPRTYAHGREAVGGAEAWPQVHPGVVRGARAAAGL